MKYWIGKSIPSPMLLFPHFVSNEAIWTLNTHICTLYIIAIVSTFSHILGYLIQKVSSNTLITKHNISLLWNVQFANDRSTVHNFMKSKAIWNISLRHNSKFQTNMLCGWCTNVTTTVCFLLQHRGIFALFVNAYVIDGFSGSSFGYEFVVENIFCFSRRMLITW